MSVVAVCVNVCVCVHRYINVFGESVLNDAVAMVLYHTLTDFVGASVTVANVFKGTHLCRCRCVGVCVCVCVCLCACQYTAPLCCHRPTYPSSCARVCV